MVFRISQLVFLMTLTSFSCLAQSNFGVRAGLNINRVAIKDRPENYGGPKTTLGFHLGAFYMCTINNSISVIPEIQLSQKEIAYENDGSTSSFKNMYLEGNVLASFKIISTVRLLVGPYAGYLVSTEPKGRFSEDVDFGLSSGINVGISKYVDAIVRYHHGLLPIHETFNRNANNTRTVVIKEYNRTIQIGISYRFNSNQEK